MPAQAGSSSARTPRRRSCRRHGKGAESESSDVVQIDLGVELDTVVALLAVEQVCLIDPHIVGQLTIGLEIACFVRHVLDDDVTLLILEVAQGDEHDVALVHPDLLTHFATDVAHTPRAVEALNIATPVAQHPQHLAVLLPILLEFKLLLHLDIVLAPFGLVTSKLVRWPRYPM